MAKWIAPHQPATLVPQDQPTGNTRPSKQTANARTRKPLPRLRLAPGKAQPRLRLVPGKA
jgi:hypothetical protein